MATYVIGDVQGCYAELQALLALIDYHPQYDRLGFTGDLVNRGPDSLAVLRFVKNLSNPWLVLGNHDLHLLVLGYQVVSYDGSHTLGQVLRAPDKSDLLEWLRYQPLLSYDPHFDAILVHAGVPPQWTLAQAQLQARYAEEQLQGPHFLECLRNLYGTQQSKINHIVNTFTRMRFCTQQGDLDLANKTKQSSIDPQQMRPWFEWYQLSHQVLFGHWAALEGISSNPNCEALDTGCVWGRYLTAYRVEDKKRFSVAATNAAR